MANGKVTASLFQCVKQLEKAGSSQKEIAEYLKISVATVRRIEQSDDFAEYRNKVNAYYFEKKAAEKKAEKAEENDNPKVEPYKMSGGTFQSGYMMNRIMDLLKEQNEALKLISNKLAFIVEQLS